MDELKKQIINIVEECGPIKAVDIVIKLPMQTLRSIEHAGIVTDVIEEMACDNELVIVKYYLPSIRDREKIVVFPKGTELYVPAYNDPKG